MNQIEKPRAIVINLLAPLAGLDRCRPIECGRCHSAGVRQEKNYWRNVITIFTFRNERLLLVFGE